MSDVNNVPIAGTTTATTTATTTTTSADASLTVGISTTTVDMAKERSPTPTSPTKSGKLLRPYDWTLSSDYCCSIESTQTVNDASETTTTATDTDTAKPRKVLSARALSETLLDGKVSNSGETTALGTDAVKVEAADSSSIELDLLKDRDAPILLYDEFILYQVCVYVFMRVIDC